jgi:hypothetical protein
VSFVNPNPNEPSYPFGGGTDNPGDDTSKAGGPSNVAATETAPLTLTGPSLTASVERHAALPVGLAQGGTDTVLPAGVQAIPVSGAGFESGANYGEERSADTGGVIAPGGAVRVPGQDETVGETETTPDTSPPAFPEPNP